MTLQSSGTIKMSEINDELGRDSTTANTSLTSLQNGDSVTINTNNASADRPDGSSPHSMSEFYSYNHSAAASELTEINLYYHALSSESACSGELAPTYYHDGSSANPVEGDNLYTNSNGTTAASDGFYRSPLVNSGFGIEEGAHNGETFSCGRSERRLKYNIEYMGDSLMGIPMYHFNYKDESYGKGRFVGTMVDDLERLGFEKALIRTKDGIFVNYDKIDVPFHNITN